ncbi:hypothetical protein B0H16DRAFT_1474965 [Mycena metata]|uniref:Uncharacterized protein n=1 Tax=Mycena metata TaxID=1033252 RepID=A0AAD7HF58_9AGAR|nr:hypothetical protein B0H16DRAFT_1474965 [Mycena metata]
MDDNAVPMLSALTYQSDFFLGPEACSVDRRFIVREYIDPEGRAQVSKIIGEVIAVEPLGRHRQLLVLKKPNLGPLFHDDFAYTLQTLDDVLSVNRTDTARLIFGIVPWCQRGIVFLNVDEDTVTTGAVNSPAAMGVGTVVSCDVSMIHLDCLTRFGTGSPSILWRRYQSFKLNGDHIVQVFHQE